MEENIKEKESGCNTDHGENGTSDLSYEENVVISVLFAMGRAVSARELSKALDCEKGLAVKAAERAAERLKKENGPLLIKKIEDKYQLCSNPLYYPNLVKLLKAPQKPVLTDVVLETMAIIAYKSPVTKVMIEKIRGVKSDHAVNKLIEYGLVEETGRLDAPGRPALFAPTDEFYRRFGVSGKDELPGVDPETEELIEEEVKEEISEAFSGNVETEENGAQA